MRNASSPEWDEAQKAYEIACRELCVASDFSWWSAGLVAFLVGEHLTWWLAPVAFVLAFYIPFSIYDGRRSKAHQKYLEIRRAQRNKDPD